MHVARLPCARPYSHATVRRKMYVPAHQPTFNTFVYTTNASNNIGGWCYNDIRTIENLTRLYEWMESVLIYLECENNLHTDPLY